MAGISFRPTKETEAALVVLMERWKCRRSHAINRALQEAVEEPSHSELSDEDMIRLSKPKKPINSPAEAERYVENVGRSATIAKPPVQDISSTKQVLRRKINPMTGKPFGPVPKC